MTRPLRVNYENAIYHVMNRGRGRATIFHGKKYREAFLLSLSEAHELFRLETLAYCLMGNHYHLLLKTPLGNLSRCMRHINGVYTQRYNKLRKTDGPLFRGRFKAILVETNNYLLQVSRYIHRNPIETQVPLVENLTDYIYSSYPAYLNQTLSPAWLNPVVVLSKLPSAEENPDIYRTYIESPNENDLLKFYSKKHLPSILGSTEFIKEIKPFIKKNSQEISKTQIPILLTIDCVVNHVAKFYNISFEQIVTLRKGKGQQNIPRKISMYLCRYKLGAKLTDIASFFNLTHYSSVGTAIKEITIQIKSEKRFQEHLELLSRDLTP